MNETNYSVGQIFPKALLKVRILHCDLFKNLRICHIGLFLSTKLQVSPNFANSQQLRKGTGKNKSQHIPCHSEAPGTASEEGCWFVEM